MSNKQILIEKGDGGDIFYSLRPFKPIDERDGKQFQVLFVVAPDGLCYYFGADGTLIK